MDRRYLAALAAALIALGVLIAALLDGGNDPAPPPVTKVDGADADRKRDDKLPLSPKAEEVVEDQERLDGPGPAGVPDQAHPDVAPEAKGELRGEDSQPAGVLPEGGGSQGFPGCTTRFVGSYSARTRAVRAIGLHYTAGPNLPGLADMNGLTAYSNRNQVSWHFLIDREGHCYYSVPLAGKAWTIGNLNSQTSNIEVVGRGNEGDYAGTAGMRKLAAVVREIGRQQRIPIRLGATDGNCNITRSGIITHWMGGGCSGGHHDIRPYLIEKVIGQIRATGGPTNVLAKGERKSTSRRCYHRRQARNPKAEGRLTVHVHWARHWIQVIAKQRATLRSLGLTAKRNRKARHRLLGSYATGRACR